MKYSLLLSVFLFWSCGGSSGGSSVDNHVKQVIIPNELQAQVSNYETYLAPNNKPALDDLIIEFRAIDTNQPYVTINGYKGTCIKQFGATPRIIFDDLDWTGYDVWSSQRYIFYHLMGKCHLNKSDNYTTNPQWDNEFNKYYYIPESLMHPEFSVYMFNPKNWSLLDVYFSQYLDKLFE